MPNSYEHSYQHDLDNVIDASYAVLAIGTEKVSTSVLKDRSLNNNDATIHEAMPSNGYFLGRRFNSDNDYVNCGKDSSLDATDEITINMMIKFNAGYGLVAPRLIEKTSAYLINTNLSGTLSAYIYIGSVSKNVPISSPIPIDTFAWVSVKYDGAHLKIYVDGILKGTLEQTGTIDVNENDLIIGNSGSYSRTINGIIVYTEVNTSCIEDIPQIQIFNTIARLPLYSHNFTQYPNSDTSLTSIFPYTSGIITSGSFNKTDGLKCTSAGQIIFSNSFEFDGNEYITLVIDGVKYSGTTTVTQGTITATIAQGSNDITIDMGTGDVLPDIRVQFREEV